MAMKFLFVLFFFFSFFFFFYFLFFVGEYEFPNEACERLTVPLVFSWIPPWQVTASWCHFSGSNSAVLE